MPAAPAAPLAEALGRLTGRAALEIDALGTRIAGNAAFAAQSGLPPGASFAALLARVHVDDRDDLQAALTRCADGGGGFDLALRWSDGPAQRWRGEYVDDGTGSRLLVTLEPATVASPPPTAVARRQQQAALRLALVTAANEIGVWEIEVDSGALRWDAQMCALYGVDDGAVPRRPAEWLERHVLPEDHERVLHSTQIPLAASDAGWARPQTRRIEHRIVRGDGAVRWIESQSARMLDDDGRHWIIGTSRDISARRDAETLLRETLQRLQLATDLANVGVFLRDPASGSGYWNRQMYLLFGIAPDDAPALPSFEQVAERLHPNDRAGYLGAWHAMRDPLLIEFPQTPVRVPLADGAMRWLMVRGRRTGAPGTPGGMVAGVVVDVTERMLIEQQAARTADRLERASHSGRIGLAERNLVTGEGHWNRTMFELAGLTPRPQAPDRDELRAMTHPADRPIVEAAWQQLVETGRPLAYESRVIRPDGSQRWLRSQATLERDADGRPLRIVGTAVDITEVREATDRLATALRRLTLATESGGIGVWERDVAREDTGTWDASMFRLFDFDPPRAPTPEDVRARVVADDLPAFDAWRERLHTSGRPEEAEVRLLQRDGSVRHLILRGRAELDAAGALLRSQGTCVDVTRIRQAEAAQRVASERLALALQTARMGVWERKLPSEDEEWDAQMRAIYGVDDDWSPSRATWLARVHPDDRPMVEATLASELRGIARKALTYRIVRGDGAVRYIEDQIRIERNERGEIVRMLGIHVDVTEARLAQIERDTLSERLRMAAAALGFALFEWVPHEHRSEWSDQMYALFGHTRESFGDKMWIDAIHPDDRDEARQLLAGIVEQGSTFGFEYRVQWPDGTVRWIANRGHIERDADGKALRVTGLNWDITESKLKEAALRAKETAERASAAKSEFLSRMSHELRTPLNAILGFTQLLELDPREPLSRVQQDRVTHISTAGWHLLTLINEVLDLSRIESGAETLDRSEVALRPLIERSLSMIAVDAERRALTVVAEIDLPEDDRVWADRLRLKQVLLNLLSNAVKYNRDGGRVTVSARRDGPMLRIAVRDTGRGLTADERAQLFQPFSRLGADSAKIEGTGIGLTITLRLVEQMRGRLEVASDPGVGSEFSVLLEAVAAPAAEAQPLQAPPGEAAA